MKFDPIPRRTAASALGGMLAGFAVLLGADVPTSMILAANLRLYPQVPWGPIISAFFLYFAWRYLNGRGWPPESSAARQRMLRARTLPTAVWLWSLISGGLGLITWGALVLLIAHLSGLGPARPPDCSQVPSWTIACVLLMSAIDDGVFQEAAFRGYIQTTMEECCGPATAILLTAALFGVTQLARGFSIATWLISFVAGLMLSLTAYLTGSIRPGIALHIGAKLVLVTSQLQGITPLSGESERTISAICVAGIVLAVTTAVAFRRLDDAVLKHAGEFRG